MDVSESLPIITYYFSSKIKLTLCSHQLRLLHLFHFCKSFYGLLKLMKSYLKMCFFQLLLYPSFSTFWSKSDLQKSLQMTLPKNYESTTLWMFHFNKTHLLLYRSQKINQMNDRWPSYPIWWVYTQSAQGDHWLVVLQGGVWMLARVAVVRKSWFSRLLKWSLKTPGL